MAVHKGKIDPAIVIRTRKVAPRVLVQAIYEEPIVDRVAVLVEKYKNARGTQHVRLFEILDVKGIESVGDLAGIADQRVHGHAADALAVGRSFTVGGTFVNL